MKKNIICILISVLILMQNYVITCGATYTNIAVNAELTPLTLRSSNDHLLVNDGIKYVEKHSQAWQIRKNTWMKFDFKEPVSFNKLDVYEVNTSKEQRLKGYKIEASKNGVDWETLSYKDDTNNTCPEVIDSKHFKGSYEFEKVTARYLRFTVIAAVDSSGNANKNIGYVEEIEVFDTMPDVKGRVIEGEEVSEEIVNIKSEIKSVDYSEIMENEAKWIKEQQIICPGSPIDGAIVRNKNHPQKDTKTDKTYYTIEPYFTTLGLIGLLDIPSEENITVVKRWVDWYLRHINREPDKYGLTGTIYTRNVNANDYTDYWSTGEYSASDSRGTTFIMLVKKLYDVSLDAQFIIERKDDLELAFDSAAVATMKEDGLTEAKNQDGHRTKYLQDNVQVLSALKDMVYLEENVFKDSLKTEYYKEYLKMSQAGLESMYMPDSEEYIYYITPNKVRLTEWNTFYGDAVSQVFPIMYDIIDYDSSRAIKLYNKFNAEQPNRVARVKETDFPWMATGIISAKMNDRLRVNEQLSTMEDKYMKNGRLWTWYIYESGNTIRAAKEMRDRLNLALLKNAFADGNSSNIATDGKLETITPQVSSVVVDLGEAKNVNRAILKSDATYKLSYSYDNINYFDIVASSGDVADFDAVKGRYFKFTLFSSSSVKEAELYYEPVNISAGKSVYASTGNPSLANDNSTVTKWISNMETDSYYKIDLGSEQVFDTVEILWDYNNCAKNYGIFVSNDDKTYKKCASETTIGDNTITEFIPEKARYIKIVNEDKVRESTGIFEVRVYNNGSSEEYKIYVDKSKLSFDVAPVLINNRLLVPFRVICEALGMQVDWQDDTKTVTSYKDGKKIVMVIGNSDIEVDGKIIKSDSTPVLHNSRTLIPLRFLAENIGAHVDWNGNTNTVDITTR